MKEIKLFKSNQNNWLTNIDFLKALEKVNAPDSNILYIHSGLNFGIPNPKLSKNEILQSLFDTLIELKVPTICFPTFTFSFCNGEDFDVINSKSKMGLLNEFFRKQLPVKRSVDPLLSVAVLGTDTNLAESIEHASIGKNSTFDMLHNRKNVRFLFLGKKIGDCFTYMHYMEKVLNVNYRYDRKFTGTIKTKEKTYTDTFELFVRYKNIIPGKGSYVYENFMLEKGIAKKTTFGDDFVLSVDEPNAFEIYSSFIQKDPNFFIDPSSKFDFDKTFEVKNMVAL